MTKLLLGYFLTKNKEINEIYNTFIDRDKFLTRVSKRNSMSLRKV